MALKNAKEKGEKEFVVSGKKYTVKEVEEMELEPEKRNKRERLMLYEIGTQNTQSIYNL